MEEKHFKQYVVSYKRNGKWYKDSERHQNIKTVMKRFNELKKENKYEEYKIVFREISLWQEIGRGDSNE